MALPDLTGEIIQDTYQRILQTDGINVLDGTGSIFIPPSASYTETASYALYAVSASHEITHELSSSYAETASYALNSDPFPYTGSAVISGSLEVIGTQRSLYTTASLTYNGSNITQITSSFEGGGNQITNINYIGSNIDNIIISGSDGINKIYTLSYDGDGNVTNIIVS